MQVSAPGAGKVGGCTFCAYLIRSLALFYLGGRPPPAYNAGMKTALRHLFVAALAVLPLAAAVAQTPAPDAVAPKAKSARPDKKIERIRTEDGGTRIDELRVGGETQQITVQPKTGGASYEVKPAEGARGTAPATTSTETNGSRVWNVMKF